MVSAKHKVTISKMSGKLNGLGGINTNPLINKFCIRSVTDAFICYYCYSKKMLKGLRCNCIPSFTNNSKLLSNKIIDINKTLPKKLNYKLVRFNAHGELINDMHFKNCIKISNKYQKTTFSLFTKRDNIIGRYIKNGGIIPKNLILVYSSHKINEINIILPKFFNKVFSVYTKEWLNNFGNKIKINCIKSCNKCKLCYSFNSVSQISEIMK